MSKKIACIFVLVSIIWINIVDLVNAEDQMETKEQLVEDVADRLSIDDVHSYWKDIHEQYGEYLPDLKNKQLVDFIKEEESVSWQSIIKGIIHFLFKELVINSKLLGTLIVLTIFSVLLHATHAAFEKSSVSKIAYFTVYIALIYIVLNSFFLVFSYAKQTIDTMSSFMIALLPLLLGIIASLGQVVSVSFFHPLIILLIHISGVLTSSFIFPLIYLSAILFIVSQLNENFKVTYLAELLRSIAIGTMMLFLTIFIGVISVQGTTSAIQDGVALKTTKFIAGNFIPVVGKPLTEAADTALSAALLLKNAVGIVGLLIIVLIAAFPLVKIAVISFIYKLVASLLQPLGKNPIIDCLHIVSKYIIYMLACVIIVTLMFFLAIVIIIISSNIPLLLR